MYVYIDIIGYESLLHSQKVFVHSRYCVCQFNIEALLSMLSCNICNK